MLWLEQIYYPAKTPEDMVWELRVYNREARALEAPVLNFSSQTRLTQQSTISGAVLQKQDANTVWLAKEEPLAKDTPWIIKIKGLSHGPRNASDGVLSAVIWESDQAHPLGFGSLMHAAPAPLSPPADIAPAAPAYFVFPWPKWLELQGAILPQCLTLSSKASDAEIDAVLEVQALAKRLYPTEPACITIANGAGKRALLMQSDRKMQSAHYRLEFENDAVTLHYADAQGCHYGLVTLAQILHFARKNWRWPERGVIEDGPAYEWRGLHFDVSRHFYDADAIANVLDVMAWLKLNRLHWHLTDDEGWRLPSTRFPNLNTVASWRGPKEKLAPQYTHLDTRYGGFYTRSEIQHLVRKARDLHIEIMPEIDLPGHSSALLAAYPELADPKELPASYHSIQGYANNALNPALPSVYRFLEGVFEELIADFPFDIVHIGGDEVDGQSWARSPMALDFARENGLQGRAPLQNYFTKMLRDMLNARGKRVAAWDECGEGDALLGSDSLLFAWRSKAQTRVLLDKGFDVVATPGQAYYLDMQTEHGWQGYGASWAGISTLKDCYEYEPPQSENGRMLGVQAGLWTEKLADIVTLTGMAFPRLYAIAEGAWSVSAQKSLARFYAMTEELPRFSF